MDKMANQPTNVFVFMEDQEAQVVAPMPALSAIIIIQDILVVDKWEFIHQQPQAWPIISTSKDTIRTILCRDLPNNNNNPKLKSMAPLEYFKNDTDMVFPNLKLKVSLKCFRNVFRIKALAPPQDCSH